MSVWSDREDWPPVRRTVREVPPAGPQVGTGADEESVEDLSLLERASLVVLAWVVTLGIVGGIGVALWRGWMLMVRMGGC